MTSYIRLMPSGQVAREIIDDDLSSRLRNDHRLIFVAVNGIPPWPCEFCEEPVNGLGRRFNGSVHHRDHDHSNNDPSNLAVAHESCHQSYHTTGRLVSAETRELLAAAQRGRSRPMSVETKERLAASMRASWRRRRTKEHHGE